MTVEAAGGVVWRSADAGLQIAVIHRPKYDDWTLPKGKLDPGEGWVQGALREVAEETGHRAMLGPGLGEVRYRVADGEKVVRYWAMAAIDGHFVPGREVDELRWVPPADAAVMLTYDRDRGVLARFTSAVERPRWTLLLRHAAAGPPSSDPPLSADGRAQAKVLGQLLADRPVTVVHSSPARRCIETVQPLVNRLDVPHAVEPSLAEDSRDAADTVRRLGLGGAATVACSHAPVIQDAVELLAKADGLEWPVSDLPPLAGGFELRFEGLRLTAITPVSLGSMA